MKRSSKQFWLAFISLVIICQVLTAHMVVDNQTQTSSCDLGEVKEYALSAVSLTAYAIAEGKGEESRKSNTWLKMNIAAVLACPGAGDCSRAYHFHDFVSPISCPLWLLHCALLR